MAPYVPLHAGTDAGDRLERRDEAVEVGDVAGVGVAVLVGVDEVRVGGGERDEVVYKDPVADDELLE
ncbi:hypothetical protein GCM10029992_07760 [Glycomyces albus]